MKKLSIYLLSAAILFPISVFADPDKDESGHGKGRGRGHDRHEYKEEYWDGNCKVERKLEKSGEYKEERKCKGARHGHYAPAPVYVPAPPPVVVEPGITVHGTVRVPY
ncbi:hypothetical protein [Noviherbaspirillum sp. Root189]|uniref:hypothetical protein n=1 Tax=Noviherbaspirillum sp. Root189 TaxID=1736487 RepID=UPI0009EB7527|nr:hypothetical protein [Noviherbaspirillum sp. Root189]